MASSISGTSPCWEEAGSLIELLDEVILAPSLSALVETILPGLIQKTSAAAALLYLQAPHLCDPLFSQVGLQADAASQIESFCAEHFQKISAAPEGPLEPVTLSLSPSLP
jgi:hypothetical protein